MVVGRRYFLGLQSEVIIKVRQRFVGVGYGGVGVGVMKVGVINK